MRRYLAFATILALTACGGGGGTPAGPGSSPTTAPTASPAPTPTAGGTGTNPTYVRPTFHITIPARTQAAGKGRGPLFVSSATLSVSIALTADALGIAPATLPDNPAVTNVNGTSGLSCTSGCTITGPSSPIGSDSYAVTTFDATGAANHQLDSGIGTFTIAQGVNNSETLTLDGIPGILVIGGVPAFEAGTSTSAQIGGPASPGVTVTVEDADGEAITGTYANPVKISDPDVNGDGTVFAPACPAYPTGNPPTASSSVVLTSDASSSTFCYGGIAENPVTLTASATGATSGSATFAPVLQAPVYSLNSGSPTSVVIGSSPPDVRLLATAGPGSTGSVLFSEQGWTNAPYDQQLSATAGTCTTSGPFASYATVTVGADTGGATPFSVTAGGSPIAGACPLSIGDGLVLNFSDADALLDTSYTTSGFTVSGRTR